MTTWFLSCVYALFLVLCAGTVEYVLSRFVYDQPFNNPRFLFIFIFVVAYKVGKIMFKDFK
jgi:hypothetical protein